MAKGKNTKGGRGSKVKGKKIPENFGTPFKRLLLKEKVRRRVVKTIEGDVVMTLNQLINHKGILEDNRLITRANLDNSSNAKRAFYKLSRHLRSINFKHKNF